VSEFDSILCFSFLDNVVAPGSCRIDKFEYEDVKEALDESTPDLIAHDVNRLFIFHFSLPSRSDFVHMVSCCGLFDYARFSMELCFDMLTVCENVYMGV